MSNTTNKRIEIRKIMDINSSQKAAALARRALMSIKSKLAAITREIEDAVIVEYTGDFVLLARDGASWKFLGIYNPDTWEGDEPEWDFCMPIPKPETMPEFQGW